MIRRGLLAVLLLVALLGCGEGEPLPESRVLDFKTPTLVFALGELAQLSGGVEWRAGEAYAWQGAQEILYLSERNGLRTAEDGQVNLKLLGSQVEVAPNSELEVSLLRGRPGEGHVILRMLAGQIKVDANHLKIETPAMTLSAITASFELLVTPTQTILSVLAGEVRAENGTEIQVVGAGEFLLGSVGLREFEALQPSSTPSQTASATPTALATNTPRPTQTASATPTALATSTPRPTQTASATPTALATSTPRPTQTASATPTALATTTPRPTQTASATPTATEEFCLGRIASESGLFARAAANPESPPIGALPYNTEVILLGQSRSGNWYLVSHPDLSAEGWMASQLLETTDVCRIEMPIVE